MSTNTRFESVPRRGFGRAHRPAALLAAALAAGAAGAAEVRFQPSADLAYYSDGNVKVVGTDRQSDEITRIGVGLELFADTQATSFSARYAPYHESYNEFTDFDNFAHVLALNLSSNFSRRSTISADLSWTRTESPPLRKEQPDAPTTFLPRTQQDRGNLALNGTVGAGKRSFFDWGVFGDSARFGSDPTNTLEDSTTYGARGGWGVEIDPTSRAGARLEGRRFEFETQDSADSESLLGFWDKDFSRESRLEVEAGAVRTNGTNDTSTKPRADVRYTRTFQASTLETGIRQDVSANTGVSGPTLDRGVYLSWLPRDRADRFDASISFYFWNRQDAFDAGVFHVRSFQTAESFSWYPGRTGFALGAFHTYYDQSDPAGTTPGLETSYNSYGIFVRYVYGRGRGERS